MEGLLKRVKIRKVLDLKLNNNLLVDIEWLENTIKRIRFEVRLSFPLFHPNYNYFRRPLNDLFYFPWKTSFLTETEISYQLKISLSILSFCYTFLVKVIPIPSTFTSRLKNEFIFHT